MDQRSESIQREIDDTRSSMTEKMEQLESKVKGTVDDVKDSVDTTIETIKSNLDLNRIVNDQPWLMFGGSILLGYMLGTMGDEQRKVMFESSVHTSDQSNQARSPGDGYTSPAQPASAQQHSEPGFMDEVMNRLGDEMDALKEAAIHTTSKMFRELLHENLPQFADEFERARTQRTESAPMSSANEQPPTAASRPSDSYARSVGGSPELHTPSVPSSKPASEDRDTQPGGTMYS